MAFPDTALPVTVEIAPGADPAADPGTWTDITSSVRLRDRIQITQGRPDEAGRVDPATCRLRLDNRTGNFTPRNPLGTWYGTLGRNTPLRVRLQWAKDTFTRTVAGDWGTATSGQVWIRLGGAAADVSVDGARGVILLPTGDTGSRSMVLPDVFATVDVRVTVRVSAVATGANLNGYIRFRHVDANNYYRLWVAFDTGGNVDLNIQVVVAGTTTTLVSAANVVTYAANSDVHARVQAIGTSLRGKVWTGATEPPAWTLTTTDSTYTSGQVGVRAIQSTGNTNTNPNVLFDNFLVTSDRFSGFVSSWPPRWDKSGRDAIVPIEANGVLRRLSQGASPLRSALFRALLKLEPLGYWSFEDLEAGITSVPSSVGGSALQVVLGEARNAWSGGALLPGSGVLPSTTLGQVVGAANYRGGALPAATSDDAWSLVGWAYTALKDDAETTNTLTVEIEVANSPQIANWFITFRFDNFGVAPRTVVDVFATDQSGTFIGAVSMAAGEVEAYADSWRMLRVTVDLSGGQHRLRVYLDEVLLATVSSAGFTVGQPSEIRAITAQVTNSSVPFEYGHFAVATGSGTDLLATNAAAIFSAGFGHAGETASDRITRLADEEGESVTVTAGDSEPLGPQGVTTYLDLQRESADADQGVLSESGFGLGFRPRSSLYNRTIDLALDFDQGQVAEPPQPTDDDQRLRNDVTVRRKDGSAARAVDTDSIAAVGRYDEELTVNVATTDGVLVNHAAWRVHLGTVDEMRWPRIDLNLAASPELIPAWLSCGVQSRVTVANPPDEAAGDDIDIIIEGYTEVLGYKDWDVSLNTSPAAPWTVGLYAGDAETAGPAEPKRYSSESSQTDAAFVAGTDTALTVATLVGQLWTTAAADLPLDIHAAGARLRVTAIAGQAASFRAVASAASGTTGSFTVSKPAGTVAGDVLVAFHTCDLGALAAMTLSGGATWLPLAAQLNEDGDGGVKAWWKVAGAAEPASYTFGQASNADGIAAVAAVAAGRPVTPHAAVVLPTGSSTTMPTPNTGPVAGCVELRWVSAEAAVTYTPPAGFTERADLASQTFVSGSLATRVVAAGGQTGVHNFTASASAPDRRGVTVNVVGTQTFTIAQAAVNGVAKTVPAATPVRLWQQAVLGL